MAAPTKTQKAKAKFCAEVEAFGLVTDSQGNYKFICAFTGRLFRIKIQTNNWRMEVHSQATGDWARVGGDYYINGLGLYSRRLKDCKQA